MLEKIRNNKIVKRALEFQKTPLYIVAVAAIAFLAHTFSLDVVGFWLIALIVFFTLIFNKDTKPVIPCIFYFLYCVSVKNGAHLDVSIPNMFSEVYFIVSVVLISVFFAASVVAHLLIYKKAVKFKKKTFLSGGLIALAIGLLTNGLFLPNYTIYNFLIGASFAALYYLVYLFFFHTMEWEKKISTRYIAHVMFFMGLLITAELGVLYLTNETLRQTFDKQYVWLGWGISNSIAFVFMLNIPFGFYLAHTSKQSLWYLLGTTAMLVAIVFTFSRAGVIVAVPLFVAGMIFACIDAKQRLPVWIMAGLMVIVGIILFVCFQEKVFKMINIYIEKGLDDSGRFELWADGFKAFLSSPIFGAGYMYKFGEMQPTFTFTWFHNTLLQFLAMGGIVGIGTYLYHRVETAIMFLKKISIDRLFIGAAIAALLINSMLDIAMSSQHIIIFYGVLLVFAEKDFLCCNDKIDEKGEWKTGVEITAIKNDEKISADKPISPNKSETEIKEKQGD